MRPEEKAKEIVDKFETLLFNEFTTDESWVKCVECALIAVELALEFCRSKDMNEEFDMIIYLLEVKHEIEQL